MRIILASASPRRRELLGQIGLDFEVRVSNVEERITSRVPGEIVEELARQKAYAVFEDMLREELGESLSTGEAVLREDCLVIGADTVVAFGDKILGKPVDEADATNMLQMLSGTTHQVYTGVAMVYYPGNQKKSECKSFYEKTDVTFFPMSDEEIAGYVASGDCMDKAGSYGIQGFCARYIQGIEGDYNNVVGLPVGRLYQEVKEWL